MIASPNIHSCSIDFAERQVLLARIRAQRAVRHLDAVGDLQIPELRNFAHRTAELAVKQFRGALGKRAFEIRQLSQ